MTLDKYDKILWISFIVMIIATTIVVIFAIIPGSRSGPEYTTVIKTNATPQSEYRATNAQLNMSSYVN